MIPSLNGKGPFIPSPDQTNQRARSTSTVTNLARGRLGNGPGTPRWQSDESKNLIRHVVKEGNHTKKKKSARKVLSPRIFKKSKEQPEAPPSRKAALKFTSGSIRHLAEHFEDPGSSMELPLPPKSLSDQNPIPSAPDDSIGSASNWCLTKSDELAAFSPRKPRFKPEGRQRLHTLSNMEKLDRKVEKEARKGNPFWRKSMEFSTRKPSSKDTLAAGSRLRKITSDGVLNTVRESNQKKQGKRHISRRWNDLCLRYDLTGQATAKCLWKAFRKNPSCGIAALIRYLEVSKDRELCCRLTTSLKKAHKGTRIKAHDRILRAFQTQLLTFSIDTPDEKARGYYALRLVPAKYRKEYVAAFLPSLDTEKFTQFAPNSAVQDAINLILQHHQNLTDLLSKLPFLASMHSNSDAVVSKIGSEIGYSNYMALVRAAASSGDRRQVQLVEAVLPFVQQKYHHKIDAHAILIASEKEKLRNNSKLTAQERRGIKGQLRSFQRQCAQWKAWAEEMNITVPLDLGIARHKDQKMRLLKNIHDSFEILTMTKSPEAALQIAVRITAEEALSDSSDPSQFFTRARKAYHSLSSAWARNELDKAVAAKLGSIISEDIETGYTCLQAYLFRDHPDESTNEMEQGRLRFLDYLFGKQYKLSGSSSAVPKLLLTFAISHELDAFRKKFAAQHSRKEKVPLSTLWRSASVATELIRHAFCKYDSHWNRQQQQLYTIVLRQVQEMDSPLALLQEKRHLQAQQAETNTKNKKRKERDLQGNSTHYVHLMQLCAEGFSKSTVPVQLQQIIGIMETEAQRNEIEDIHKLADNMYFLRNLVPLSQLQANSAGILLSGLSGTPFEQHRWTMELVFSAIRFLSCCCRRDGKVMTSQLTASPEAIEGVNELIEAFHKRIHTAITGYALNN